MSSPFFSIIVPVFKTEPFLEQCLKSIKEQIFADFECLLINDGSAGVSNENFIKDQDENFKHSVDLGNVKLENQAKTIFDKICRLDSRFKYFYQENSGLSSARNLGLNNIKGKWLLLVDSDDWITPEHLQNIRNAINNFETDKNNKKKLPLVRMIFTEFYNTKNKLNIYIPNKLTLANTIHSCTLNSCNNALNTQILKKYNLMYDIKLGRGSKIQTRISNGGEDFLMAYQYLEAVEKEFGMSGFEVIDISPKSYKYREVQTAQKSTEDDMGPYEYAKYFQQFGYQNPRLNIKIITFILPFWARLRFYKNPFATFLRKILSFFLRLISG